MTNNKEKNVLIIDAMNLIHRSFFAYPRLESKNGIPTGALLGFIKYLKSLQDKFNPEHIIVCSDAHRRCFRHDIYPEYKATRGETDEELRGQFALMEEYLRLCNAKFIKKNNYEGDDLVGTLAKRAKDYGYFAYVVSGDKDNFQLIDDNVHQVYLATTGMEIYDEERLAERYNGLTPAQIIELKALSGDTSDNIPGVRSIGEKTAIALLNEYNTLDGVYENIDKIKGKRQEKLIEDKENAYLSRRLATIEIEVPINVDELFKIDSCFSLCTKDAYEYLQSLDIKIFKKEEIKIEEKPAEKTLNLPFDVVSNDVGDIYFRSPDKYAGSTTRDGMDIYLYSMLMRKENRNELMQMIVNAKNNLIMEDESNIEKIQRIEEEQKELLELLFKII